MKTTYGLLAFVLVAFTLAACERTPADVEKWRGTERETEKMIEWVTSPDEPTPVRVRALQILIEEDGTPQIGPTLKEVEDGEVKKKIVGGGVETVERLWKEGSPDKLGKTETQEERKKVKKTLDAKDAAYFLIPHTTGEDKKALQAIIDEWLSEDWKLRTDAGQTDYGQLLEWASQKGRESMLQWLKETDSPFQVASMLRENTGDEMKEEIAKILKKKAEEAHPNLSDSLARAVVETEHELIVPYLKKAIADPEIPGKFVDQAMEAVKNIEGEKATNYFSELIRDHTGPLRWAAVNDLIKLRGKAGILAAASSLPLEKESYSKAAEDGKTFKENAGWFASFAIGEMIASDVSSISSTLVRALENERWPVQVIGLTSTARAVTCATKAAECGEGPEAKKQTQDLFGGDRDQVLEAVENLTSSDEEIPTWGEDGKTVGALAEDVAEAMKNAG